MFYLILLSVFDLVTGDYGSFSHPNSMIALPLINLGNLEYFLPFERTDEQLYLRVVIDNNLNFTVLKDFSFHKSPDQRI
jgi:hypothetical protein